VIREAALEHNPAPSVGSLTPQRKRPFLVSSTRSPLASPRTPIHKLAAALQSHLYFPDPAPVYAVCGTIIANTLRGYPVWLMLIGPPESGKTELLKPLLNLHGLKECGDLSGKAALLSATKTKDWAKDATGGLLRGMEKGEDGTYRGALVMLDFARTVLAADPASARATLGAIGMLHDQHYQREVGTDGGRTISFYGRIGFLAACTDVIDHPDHHQANAEMGERCIFFRYPVSSGYHEINSTLDNPDGTEKSGRINELFQEWAEDTVLDWNNAKPPRPLEEHEKKSILALSQLAARARSGVQRDRYAKNEISGISRSALGPRIANTLAQLLRGMEWCGCTPEEIGKVLRQCAMDSLPAARSMIIKAVSEGARGVSEIAAILRISGTAAKRTLEDLQVHGITVCDRPDGNGQWLLSNQAEQMLTSGWGE
jgi:hypothetical protein